MAEFDLSSDPKAVRVRKRPVARAVVFAAADGVCRTLEGDVAYRAGDAIVTGVSRFSRPEARRELEGLGVRTHSCDLADGAQVAALPTAANVFARAIRA